MGRINRPRRGSLQYWPRKRARTQNIRVRSWLNTGKTQLAGFAGYKAGMTHISYLNKSQGARGRNKELVAAATVIECPPLRPFSIRFYKQTPYGWKVITELLSKNLHKNLSRRMNLPKKHEKEIPAAYDDIRLLCHTQPYLTSLSKKSPEIIELGISGERGKKLEYAQSLLEKEIRVAEVFQDLQYVDVHAVTKGKGLQGAVKRFGVALKQKKSEKKKRSTGNLGAFTPRKVLFTVAHPGQTGYHSRTEHNKAILKVNPAMSNQQGFRRYGLIKQDAILIKGSIPGPRKRLIKLTPARRHTSSLNLEVRSIATRT